MAIRIGVPPGGTPNIGHTRDVGSGSKPATTTGGGAAHGLEAAGTKMSAMPRNARLPGAAGLLNLPGLVGAGQQLAGTAGQVLSGQKSLARGAKEAFRPALTLASAVPGPVGLAATAASLAADAAPTIKNLAQTAHGVANGSIAPKDGAMQALQSGSALGANFLPGGAGVVAQGISAAANGGSVVPSLLQAATGLPGR